MVGLGGNCGKGDDLTVLLLVEAQGNRGVPPGEGEWRLEGGPGGEPGIGGQGGRGRRGGKGGIAGCDGRLVVGSLGFGAADSACGEPRIDGKDADRAEAASAAGRWVRDGMPGLK